RLATLVHVIELATHHGRQQAAPAMGRKHADARQPKTRIEDGVWLRMVDVPAALKGRRYAVDGRLLLRVRDAFCPWNDGQYELIGGPGGAEWTSNGGTAGLALGAAGLAGLFLGGNRF